MASKFNPDYFRCFNLYLGIPVLLLTLLINLVMFWPDSALIYLYGPLGQLAIHLEKHQPRLIPVIYKAGLATHLAEAVYAFYLCRKKGLNTGATWKWTIQTSIVGFPSLQRLVQSQSNIDKKTE